MITSPHVSRNHDSVAPQKNYWPIFSMDFVGINITAIAVDARLTRLAIRPRLGEGFRVLYSNSLVELMTSATQMEEPTGVACAIY